MVRAAEEAAMTAAQQAKRAAAAAQEMMSLAKQAADHARRAMGNCRSKQTTEIGTKLTKKLFYSPYSAEKRFLKSI